MARTRRPPTEATRAKLSESMKASCARRKAERMPQVLDDLAEVSEPPEPVIEDDDAEEPVLAAPRVERDREMGEFHSLWRRTPTRLLGRR